MNNEYVKNFEAELNSLVEKLRGELQGIRSNRPSAELVENIAVEYYGQRMSVKQLGSISVKPPREINIAVWDKNAVSPAMKAIESAGAGLSLSSEGNLIRAFLPALTEERRQELMKLSKKIAEKYRIELRNRRDEVIKKAKSSEEKKEISEDDLFKVKDEVQKTIDETNKKIEGLLDSKIKELEE